MRLILMRHAKSSWDEPATGDFDRPLNARGRRSAALIGDWLAGRGYRPDRALVSPARRTRETWDGIAAALGAEPAVMVRELYHAGPEAMLAVLRRAEGETVLMLGHQPGIGAFAAALLQQAPEDAGFARYPTAATAVIDFEAEAWGEVGWGRGRLVDFVVPRALE